MRKAFLTFWIPVFFLFSCASLTKNPLDRPPAELMAKGETEFQEGDYLAARETLEALKGRDGERKYYARAQLLIADAYYAEGLYPEAALEYQAFLDFHTYHERAPYAQYGLALCYLDQVDTVDRSYENVQNARRELRKLLDRYPRNPYREAALAKLARCRNLLAEYEDYVGSFYFRKEAWEAAISRYEGLLRDYPESTIEAEVMLKLGRAYLALKETDKGREALNRLLSKYPSTREAARARTILEKL